LKVTGLHSILRKLFIFINLMGIIMSDSTGKPTTEQIVASVNKITSDLEHADAYKKDVLALMGLETKLGHTPEKLKGREGEHLMVMEARDRYNKSHPKSQLPTDDSKLSDTQRRDVVKEILHEQFNPDGLPMSRLSDRNADAPAERTQMGRIANAIATIEAERPVHVEEGSNVKPHPVAVQGSPNELKR